MQSNRISEIACLLDTDIAIDFLRRREYAQKLLNDWSQKGLIAISAITQLEVYRGMRAKEEKDTNYFLDGLITLTVETPIARRAGIMLQELRSKGMTIGIADAVIAATALHIGTPLLTNNIEHYAFPALKVTKGLQA